MEPNYTIGIDWGPVERALQEGTYSGYKIAVIETEKIFRKLAEERAPDKTYELSLERISAVVSAPEEFSRARKMYERIIEEPGFEISREDTKEIIAGYWHVITDLQQAGPDLLRPRQFRRFGWFGKKIIYSSAGALLLFFILVILLGETEPGRRFSVSLVAIAHIALFRIIPAIGILTTIAVIVLYILRRRRYIGSE